MAITKLKVIVTAAHVVLDTDGAQLVPGYIYDVKDAPSIQQLIEDGQLGLVIFSDEEKKPTPSTTNRKNDSASADSATS